MSGAFDDYPLRLTEPDEKLRRWRLPLDIIGRAPSAGGEPAYIVVRSRSGTEFAIPLHPDATHVECRTGGDAGDFSVVMRARHALKALVGLQGIKQRQRAVVKPVRLPGVRHAVGGQAAPALASQRRTAAASPDFSPECPASRLLFQALAP